MTDARDPLFAPAARCGRGTIDGAVWRPGDPVKHLGPPEHLGIRLWSKLFSTWCGLGPQPEPGYGRWQPQEHDGFREDDDYWCPPCLDQAGISYELWPDDEPEGGGSEQRPGP
jgi:hypothetical protein